MNATDRYDSLFRYYAEQAGLDEQMFVGGWRLLKAQALQESRLDPNAKSAVGALGLAQFMQRTWEEWRDGIPGIQSEPPHDLVLLNPRDPEDAIRSQAAYMAWLLRQFEGNVRPALAAYNWGIGRVKQAIKIHGDAFLAAAPEETRQYVPRILRILGDLIAQDPPVSAASGAGGGHE